MAVNEWAGVVHQNAPKYVKGYEDKTIRGRYFLSLLKQKGRFEYNQGGHQCNWQVKIFQQTVNPYTDGQRLTFNRLDRYRRLTIDWRGYTTTDLMTKLEKDMNKGDTALIRRYDEIAPDLMKDIADSFSGELFRDGYATGREKCIHGLESFMGLGTTAAGDIIGQPSDTYAGQSTALGTDGGVWSDDLTTQPNSTISKDWPYGSGDSQYDWNAPKVANWSSSAWGTGSTAWEDNCHRTLSTMQTWLNNVAGRDGAVDLFLCDSTLFQGYKNSLESLRRVQVPHKGANDLGFGNVLNQDGMAITSDFDCPSNTGYFLNVSHMKVSSLAPQLFWSEGPNYEPAELGWLWTVGFFGNAKYEPRFFGKCKNIA